MMKNVAKYINFSDFSPKKKLLRLGSKIEVKGFWTSGFRKSIPFGLIFFKSCKYVNPRYDSIVISKWDDMMLREPVKGNLGVKM